VNEEHFGQIFVTDANKERIVELFGEIGAEPRIFKVKQEEIETH
jgi:hypothetical protein